MPDDHIEFGGDVSDPGQLLFSLKVREQFEAQRLRRMIVVVALFLFGASNISILALFVWKAAAMNGCLSDRVLLYLAGITISQNAAIVLLITKFFFRGKVS